MSYQVQRNFEMTLSNGEAALAKKSQVTIFSCTLKFDKVIQMAGTDALFFH
jgi:hypothetical protein